MYDTFLVPVVGDVDSILDFIINEIKKNEFQGESWILHYLKKAEYSPMSPVSNDIMRAMAFRILRILLECKKTQKDFYYGSAFDFVEDFLKKNKCKVESLANNMGVITRFFYRDEQADVYVDAGRVNAVLRMVLSMYAVLPGILKEVLPKIEYTLKDEKLLPRVKDLLNFLRSISF